MRIYVKNNPVKFHSRPIWNDDGTLGFFEERRHDKNKNNNKMSSDTGSVSDPKSHN